MNTIPLKFDIGTTNADTALGVRVLVDGAVIYDNSHVTESYHFSHDVSDEDGEHELIVELYGKKSEHTVINEAGEITQDSLITISNIHIDGIDIEQLVQEIVEYHHDFNGTQAPVVDKFFGAIGCNGQIKFKFTTPIYLWLLENM